MYEIKRGKVSRKMRKVEEFGYLRGTREVNVLLLPF
jgi:hypothetical protein